MKLFCPAAMPCPGLFLFLVDVRVHISEFKVDEVRDHLGAHCCSPELPLGTTLELKWLQLGCPDPLKPMTNLAFPEGFNTFQKGHNFARKSSPRVQNDVNEGPRPAQAWPRRAQGRPKSPKIRRPCEPPKTDHGRGRFSL